MHARGKIESQSDLQCQEDKDFSPDTSMVGECIDTKGFECGEDNKDGSPAMVEREGQVNEDLVTPCISDMVLLYDIVDMLRKKVNYTCRVNVHGTRRTVTAELTNRANIKAKRMGQNSWPDLVGWDIPVM